LRRSRVDLGFGALFTMGIVVRSDSCNSAGANAVKAAARPPHSTLVRLQSR
jgi:hypothetical protein